MNIFLPNELWHKIFYYHYKNMRLLASFSKLRINNTIKSLTTLKFNINYNQTPPTYFKNQRKKTWGRYEHEFQRFHHGWENGWELRWMDDSYLIWKHECVPKYMQWVFSNGEELLKK